MLFNSYIYIFVFLPITFIGYRILDKLRLSVASKVWLVGASLLFYSYWNMNYLALILGSMFFNFSIGSVLNQKNISLLQKKYTLTFGVISNLALLGYFKYTDFFIKNINMVAGFQLQLLYITLPLAISFFTFQQISYLVDSYKGETHEYKFINYALFVTFFPQLIAGPIVHHSEMMPQFSGKPIRENYERHILEGIFIFCIGLFKKIMIADRFAVISTQGFNNAPILNFVESWITTISFYFQIYYDFSGYTDMAIGTALLFNIRLPINFNSPYKSINIQEFWRRWHITLSRFLRDYIYISFGGNRTGNLRTYLNLFITFLIGGIWHGASWTFVIWGALHGVGIIIHRIWQRRGIRIPTALSWLLTFIFINLTWVFFRAADFENAIHILRAMIGLNGLGLMESKLFFNLAGFKWYYLSFYIITMASVLFFKNSNKIKYRLNPSYYLWIAAFLFVVSIIYIQSYSEFLYFEF